MVVPRTHRRMRGQSRLAIQWDFVVVGAYSGTSKMGAALRTKAEGVILPEMANVRLVPEHDGEEVSSLAT